MTAFAATVVDYPVSCNEHEEWREAQFKDLLAYFREQLRRNPSVVRSGDGMRYQKLVRWLLKERLLRLQQEDGEPFVHIEVTEEDEPVICCHGDTVAEAVDSLPEPDADQIH